MREIRTKVVGVTHDNNDGSNRQKWVRKLIEGDFLFFLHDPDNPHDPNAIEIYYEHQGWFRTSYKQIGHLGREVAEQVATHMSRGGQAGAEVTEVTGGPWDKPTYGVNILVFMLEEGDV